MKSKDLSEIYQNLEPREQASMAFESLVAGDIGLAKKITDSVPRYQYRSVDTDYSRTFDKIFEVCSMWSIEYWKTNCHFLACLIPRIDPGAGENIVDIEECQKYRDKLEAIGCVLKSFAESQGINIDSVLKFSDVTTFAGKDIESCELDDSFIEYHSNMLALCESMITGESLTDDQEQYFQNAANQRDNELIG